MAEPILAPGDLIEYETDGNDLPRWLIHQDNGGDGVIKQGIVTKVDKDFIHVELHNGQPYHWPWKGHPRYTTNQWAFPGYLRPVKWVPKGQKVTPQPPKPKVDPDSLCKYKTLVLIPKAPPVLLPLYVSRRATVPVAEQARMDCIQQGKRYLHNLGLTGVPICVASGQATVEVTAIRSSATGNPFVAYLLCTECSKALQGN